MIVFPRNSSSRVNGTASKSKGGQGSGGHGSNSNDSDASAKGMTHRHKAKYSEVKRFENWKFTQAKRKELREVDRHKKSAALRKYAKLCLKEGIVSDRVNLEKAAYKTGEDAVSADRGDREKKKKGRTVPAPFEAALKIAEERKAEKLRIESEKQKKEKDIKRAEKTRSMKRTDHLKRTKSGQPIMNNQIKNILEKLQSDKK